jgi:hypothetical protein
MRTLTLVIGYDNYSSDVDDLFAQFTKGNEDKITKFCKITKKTEHQLDNFGPGSAWLDESPYSLTLGFENNNITLTITDTNT